MTIEIKSLLLNHTTNATQGKAAAKSIIPNPILNTNFCAMFSIAIPRIFEHNTLAKKLKRV